MTSLRVLIGNAPSFRSILRGEIQHVLGKAKVKELPGGFVVNSAPEGLWRMAHSLRTAEFLRVVVGRGKASSNDEVGGVHLSKGFPYTNFCSPSAREDRKVDTMARILSSMAPTAAVQ